MFPRENASCRRQRPFACACAKRRVAQQTTQNTRAFSRIVARVKEYRLVCERCRLALAIGVAGRNRDAREQVQEELVRDRERSASGMRNVRGKSNVVFGYSRQQLVMRHLCVEINSVSP